MDYQPIQKPNCKTLVVLSGGIDSSLCAFIEKAKGAIVKAVYVDYGKHSSIPEKRAARLIANHLCIPLEIINFKGFYELQLGYMPMTSVMVDGGDTKWLTESHNFIMSSNINDIDNRISARKDELVISGYHSLLSLTSFCAQIDNISSLTVGLIIDQIQVNKHLEDGIKLLSESLTKFNPKAGNFKIHAPLKNMQKKEVVIKAAQLGIPFELTWSCLFGEQHHCGECIQCRSRKSAFKEAGVEDPIIYLK